MGYSSLRDCIGDLERNGHLVRVKEMIDPDLEMAAVHLRVHEAGGPALLFENVKGCAFPAASNLFGTKERSRFIFRDAIENVKALIRLKSDPSEALRHPFRNWKTGWAALKSFPKKTSALAVLENEIRLHDLPQIRHWPDDGGAFVTLPAVYTEDPEFPGVMHSNLGMYRIQLNGNEYVRDREAGLHYQLHRGIGVHQSKWNAKGLPMKVSVFVGGPPSLTFSAVMPLPEGISEMTFAGVLGNRKIRYGYRDGFCISGDADFVITGEVHPGENKPEGPFGDHFGYYSLTHPFPVMRIHKVWHRKNAIWPFTVVGRPPQEDTSFGWLVHELAGKGIQDEIPGLKQVHAVDAAGVHPLLLATGGERYTPYLKEKRPSELLTIASHILGTGQLSLAKYLFIAEETGEKNPDAENIPVFFQHVLERIDLSRDVHFHTNTSIDTLDYSGDGLNTGSKVVFAACGEKKRTLSSHLLTELPGDFHSARLVFPGVTAISGPRFSSAEKAKQEIAQLCGFLAERKPQTEGLMIIVVCDDSQFTAHDTASWLWVTFTKSNPARDIYGVNDFYENKHWGCRGPLIIDARTKTHHAPPLEKDPTIETRIDRFFVAGGSLHGIA
ncbi:MAG TPA: UbiD family decarboxylase [Bacteroidia bacterium]|nr:UbiD family decarboxylase [Bacteroidia bacterium]